MIETDLYPSRCNVEPGLLKRKDPVYYGPPASRASGARLSARQIENYVENGFLFFKALFSPSEVAQYKAVLDRLRQDEGVRADEESFLETDSHEVRSIFNIHRRDPVFRELARDPRILEPVMTLLASPVYIHQSRVNYKPGFHGREFFWHSDFETWHVEDGMPRMRAISCSIVFTENDFYNGPLLLIPGSHQYFIPCLGETPPDHYKQSLRRQEYGVPDPESLKRLMDRGGVYPACGPAGSMILFDCNIMHGSNRNISPWPRSNVFFVYNSVENYLEKPFGKQKQRPEYIASRDFSPLRAD